MFILYKEFQHMGMKKERIICTWTKDEGLTTLWRKDKLIYYYPLNWIAKWKRNAKFGEVVGELESPVMVGEYTDTSTLGRSLHVPNETEYMIRNFTLKFTSSRKKKKDMFTIRHSIIVMLLLSRFSHVRLCATP